MRMWVGLERERIRKRGWERARPERVWQKGAGGVETRLVDAHAPTMNAALEGVAPPGTPPGLSAVRPPRDDGVRGSPTAPWSRWGAFVLGGRPWGGGVKPWRMIW